jgi:hypothetical protein
MRATVPKKPAPCCGTSTVPVNTFQGTGTSRKLAPAEESGGGIEIANLVCSTHGWRWCSRIRGLAPLIFIVKRVATESQFRRIRKWRALAEQSCIPQAPSRGPV